MLQWLMNKVAPQEAEKLMKEQRKIFEGIKGKKTAPQIHSHITATLFCSSLLR